MITLYILTTHKYTLKFTYIHTYIHTSYLRNTYMQPLF